MNDNEPQLLSSFPLSLEKAKVMAEVFTSADGSTSLERLLGELALLPGYEVVPQENGMVALARLGGEGTMLLFPNAALIPMMAETILKFMVPAQLTHLVQPGMNTEQVTLLLTDGVF